MYLKKLEQVVTICNRFKSYTKGNKFKCLIYMRRIFINFLIGLSVLTNIVLVFLFSELYKDYKLLETKAKTIEAKLNSLQQLQDATEKVAETSNLTDLQLVGLGVFIVIVFFAAIYLGQQGPSGDTYPNIDGYTTNRDVIELLSGQTRGLEGSQAIKHEKIVDITKDIISNQEIIMNNQEMAHSNFTDACNTMNQILTELIKSL